jgi:hypothetical protein
MGRKCASTTLTGSKEKVPNLPSLMLPISASRRTVPVGTIDNVVIESRASEHEHHKFTRWTKHQEAPGTARRISFRSGPSDWYKNQHISRAGEWTVSLFCPRSMVTDTKTEMSSQSVLCRLPALRRKDCGPYKGARLAGNAVSIILENLTKVYCLRPANLMQCLLNEPSSILKLQSVLRLGLCPSQHASKT